MEYKLDVDKSVLKRFAATSRPSAGRMTISLSMERKKLVVLAEGDTKKGGKSYGT